jgi:hypothetical protein
MSVFDAVPSWQWPETMLMRFIPTRAHGVLDYTVGALLILAPFLFGFEGTGLPAWLFGALGAGAIVYAFFTDYEWGVIPTIPMPVHLVLDAGSGVLLATSPWLFGFAEQVWGPHLFFGLFEITAALTTRTRSYERTAAAT